MQASNLITANDFCFYHNVEYSFITLLEEAGLIEVTIVNQTTFIPETELSKLEKMISLHQLDINVAGIEAITHLLNRMEQMQENLKGLHNRLIRYEGE